VSRAIGSERLEDVGRDWAQGFSWGGFIDQLPLRRWIVLVMALGWVALVVFGVLLFSPSLKGVALLQ